MGEPLKLFKTWLEKSSKIGLLDFEFDKKCIQSFSFLVDSIIHEIVIKTLKKEKDCTTKVTGQIFQNLLRETLDEL